MSTTTANPIAVTCAHCNRTESAHRGWFQVGRRWGAIFIRPYSPYLDEWSGSQPACGEQCAVVLTSLLITILHQEELRAR